MSLIATFGWRRLYLFKLVVLLLWRLLWSMEISRFSGLSQILNKFWLFLCCLWQGNSSIAPETEGVQQSTNPHVSLSLGLITNTLSKARRFLLRGFCGPKAKEIKRRLNIHKVMFLNALQNQIRWGRETPVRNITSLDENQNDGAWEPSQGGQNPPS